MCLTIPAQVIEIKNNSQKATVKIGKKTVSIDISLLPALKSKNWVLCANGAAVRKITAKEAKEIIKIFKNLHK